MPGSDPRPDVLKSGLFDAAYYARQVGAEFGSEAEALAHYREHGWRKGLAPSPLFDTRFYLRRNADVRVAGTDPLEHYLGAGRREGRPPRIGRGRLRDRPTAPPASRWTELAASRAPPADLEDSPESVDVVVPAYRGLDDTLACLHSVLSSNNRTPFRLTVIDDASPEPELSEALRGLEALGLIVLLRNPANLGFVETANRGFALSEARDVLLLNADTLVHGDWLDRIRAHATDRVATVTPLSNNATILSYPYAPGNNNQELELPDAELDAIFAEANRGLSAEIPTGVGFCFHVARAALRELGAFDPAFSPGYGEENDFCMRARAAGWRNLAALDVFVRHTGETSFSDPAGRKAAATAKLNARHPDYQAQVDAFMAADPLRPARARADLVRAGRLGAGRAVLMVEHGWGGGVGRHIDELSALLRREGVQSFRLRPAPSGRELLLDAIGDHDLPNLPSLDPTDPEQMARVLEPLRLGHAHIHSLVGYDLAWFGPLVAAFETAGLAYDFTWHDYAPVCPRLVMVDWGGIYCESPSTDYCQVCVDKAGTRFGPVDIHRWRGTYDGLLRGARRTLVPDPDVADRLRRYAPALTPLVRPHPETEARPARPIPASRGGPSVVGLLGRLGPFKGAGLLLRLAGDALERDLPIRYRLWGATTRPEFARFPHVELMGEYLEDELEDRLAASPPSLLFFPSVCPETFSYTLDVAFRTGLHPVCLDIGAPARRLRSAGLGTILPLSLALDPSALNDRLLTSPVAAPPAPAPSPDPAREWDGADAYYAGLPRRSR